MRIMSIDPGSARLGIAISDPLRTVAQPLEFVPAEPEAEVFPRLSRLVSEHEVEKIVVGMPRNMDGSYGGAAETVRAFVERLRTELKVPVITWDERLTSVQAHRML